MKRFALLFFILAYFVACKNSPKPREIVNAPTIDTEKIQVRNSFPEKNKNITDSSAPQNLSCLELLKILVDKSDFNPSLKQLKFDVHIDEFADSIVRIELTTRNEERHDDVALSWLNLNLVKNN